MILQPYQRERIATDTTYQQAKAVLERNGENLEATLSEIQTALQGQEAELSEYAAMYGPPSNRTVGTGKTVLNNWPNEVAPGGIVTDASSGIITLPSPGVYRVSGYIYGTQGNDTKEEDMFLGLRVANSPGQDGDYDLWNFMVATDKTQYRSFMFSIARPFSGDAAQLSLYMYATAGTGTFGFEYGTFEVREFN